MTIRVNGEELRLPEAVTVSQLLERLELANMRVAVEINREVSPRGEHPSRELRDGDALEIVGFVGGG